MPIDIKIEATAISITKNGIYTKKPIIKAVFNSEIINAGIIVHIPSSSTEAGFGRREALMNKAKSCSDVCRNINSRIGLMALSIPSW